MNRTKNELADYAWNPVTGCLKDCRYCYAKKSALRFASDWRRNLAERPKVQQVGADLFELDAPWETANNRFLNVGCPARHGGVWFPAFAGRRDLDRSAHDPQVHLQRRALQAET